MQPAHGSFLAGQSVKSSSHGGAADDGAGKRIKDHQRHLMMETLGLVLRVIVTPTDTAERDRAKAILRRELARLTWRRLLRVDGGYIGAEFVN